MAMLVNYASVADPELFLGSGIIVPDQDPAKNEAQINKNCISNFRPGKKNEIEKADSW